MIQRTLLGTLLSTALFYFFGGAVADGVLAEVELPAALVSVAPTDEAPAEATPVAPVAPVAKESAIADPDERAVLAYLRSRHTGMSRHDECNVARAVVREAHRYDFDPALVLAVITVESGGYNLAVSHVGAMGLMQLLPATAEELADKLDLDWRGPDSLFDPVLNVKLGTAYIKLLTDRYGDVSTALAAYNWGPGRIDRHIRKGWDVPSRYAKRVMKALDVAEAQRETSPTRG